MKKLILLTLIIVSVISGTAAQTNHESQNNSSEILTGWMDLHCRMVRNAKGIAHVAYSRHFAYTAIAAYESIVNGDPQHRSLAGQVTGLEALPAAPKKINWPLSLNASYAAMLRYFYAPFGNCAAVIDSMENIQKEKYLKQANAAIADQSARFGRSVAEAIIRWAEQDGSNTSKVYAPSPGEGLWIPGTVPAAAPFFAENRSFTPGLLGVFTLVQPVYSADSSSMFYKMAKEVYNVSRNLTAEQKAIALHWDDSPDGKYMTVFGHWTCILSQLIKQDHSNIFTAAEAFARMSISMQEAAILAWKGKYQYRVVRPITYIQKYFDAQWSPLIATPPHPEFPAAHATLSNAAATALGYVFGNSFAMTDSSYLDIGMQARKYASIQQAAKEAGYSRLYGGIHYRYSIEQGFILGANAAKYVGSSIHFRKSE